MRNICDYSDCDVFKPGEVWRSQRGLLWKVISVTVGGDAVMCLGNDGSGRKQKRKWDDVVSWVRVASASE